MSIDVLRECSVRKLTAADGRLTAFEIKAYVHTDVKYLDQDFLVRARTGTQESLGTAQDEPPTSQRENYEVNIK